MVVILEKNIEIEDKPYRQLYHSKYHNKWIFSKTIKTYIKREGRFGYYDCSCGLRGCCFCIPNYNKDKIRKQLKKEIKKQVLDMYYE